MVETATWTFIGLGAAAILFLIRYLVARPKPYGGGVLTYADMSKWSDERIITVKAEELIEFERDKKTQLFNVVSEHMNDGHELKKMLTPAEYAGYEKAYRELRRRAEPNIRELYENLVQLTKNEHQRRQKTAA